MFYTDWFTERDHPLATVWLASTLTKKLTRNQYIGANISASVDFILDQQHPMALRLSSQLLLGVASIFKHKVEYLQNETQYALNKVRQAFASNRQDTALSATTLTQKKSNSANTLEKTLTNTVGSLMPAFPFQLGDLPTLNGLSSQTMAGRDSDSFSSEFDRRLSIEVGRSASQQLAENMGIDLTQHNQNDNEVDEVETGRELQAHFDEPIDLGFDIQDLMAEDAAANKSIDHNEGFGVEDAPELDNPIYDEPLTPLEELPPTPPAEQLEDVPEARPQKKRMIRMANVDDDIYLKDTEYQDFSGVEHPQLNPIEYVPDSFPAPTAYNFMDPHTLSELLKRKRDQDEQQQQQNTPPADVSVLDDDLVANISVGDLEGDLQDLQEVENVGIDIGPQEDYGPQEDNGSPVVPELPDREPTALEEPESRPSLYRQQLKEQLAQMLPTEHDTVHFSEISALQTKSQKANNFFELLVLATSNSVTVKQAEPYSDISIQAKPGLYEIAV